jgi:acyl dehydratase
VSCRFRGNVFAGDRLEVTGTVTAVHPAEDGADVDVDVEVAASGRPRVLVGTATVRLPA